MDPKAALLPYAGRVRQTSPQVVDGVGVVPGIAVVVVACPAVVAGALVVSTGDAAA
jgi:hypothetical protein